MILQPWPSWSTIGSHSSHFRKYHQRPWDAIVAIREHRLEAKKEEISTHLIRLGAAMAMYLGDCTVYMISMLIGRWLSNAFLGYIRKQVIEFSQKVAKKMLTYQNFHHIPDIHRRISRDDLRQRKHPNNAKTKQNVGGNMLCQACLPPFSQYHSLSWNSTWAVGLPDGGKVQIANLGSGEGKNWLLLHQSQTHLKDSILFLCATDGATMSKKCLGPKPFAVVTQLVVLLLTNSTIFAVLEDQTKYLCCPSEAGFEKKHSCWHQHSRTHCIFWNFSK